MATDRRSHGHRDFTILTTIPNIVVAPIHNRMPVVFDSTRASRWLHPDLKRDELLAMLKPAEDGFFNRVQVGRWTAR